MSFGLHREHQFKEVSSDCRGIYQGRVSTQEKTVASCQQQLPESELSLQVSVLTSEIDLPLALFSTWILKDTFQFKGEMSEEWEGVKVILPIAESAHDQILHSHVQLWMCEFMAAIFSTMVPPKYLAKELGKKHLLKGSSSLQYSTYSQLWWSKGVTESWPVHFFWKNCREQL